LRHHGRFRGAGSEEEQRADRSDKGCSFHDDGILLFRSGVAAGVKAVAVRRIGGLLFRLEKTSRGVIPPRVFQCHHRSWRAERMPFLKVCLCISRNSRVPGHKWNTLNRVPALGPCRREYSRGSKWSAGSTW
jgi:hypothetical protein